VARASDALEERRDRPGHADLDDEVHVADVDAEFERRRGDERAQAAVLQAVLGVEPALLRERPVVTRDRGVAETSRMRAETRSASFRVLTKTSVVRCSRTSSPIRA